MLCFQQNNNEKLKKKKLLTRCKCKNKRKMNCDYTVYVLHNALNHSELAEKLFDFQWCVYCH